jgi:protein arginine kinase activator
MICENCHKNVATVHLTEIVNKQKKEIHLCEDCAKEKGVSIKSHFSVSNLLGGLVQSAQPQQEELPGVSCANCGMTFSEFKSKGRLGCMHDYKVFKQGLQPLIEKIHGSTQHLGKVPSRVGKEMARERKLLKLRQELKLAIEREEYEKAAEIRDRIYAAEGKRDTEGE